MVRLYRVYLNSSGYDSTGKYWGVGKPLYRIEFEDANDAYQYEVRAYNREEAKKEVDKAYPGNDFRYYR